MNVFQLNRSDEKIRRHWLILTFLRYLGIAIVYLIIFLPFFLKNNFYNNDVVLTLIVPVSGRIIGFAAIYHCAYRKHGNRLLTFGLIVGLLTTLRGLGETLQELEYTTETWSYVFLLEGGLYIWWYILSIKLLKINKRIRSDSIRESESYLQTMQILQTATTLESLDSMLNSIRKDRDDGDVNREAVIAEAYYSRKDVLLSQKLKSSEL